MPRSNRLRPGILGTLTVFSALGVACVVWVVIGGRSVLAAETTNGSAFLVRQTPRPTARHLGQPEQLISDIFELDLRTGRMRTIFSDRDQPLLVPRVAGGFFPSWSADLDPRRREIIALLTPRDSVESANAAIYGIPISTTESPNRLFSAPRCGDSGSSNIIRYDPLRQMLAVACFDTIYVLRRDGEIAATFLLPPNVQITGIAWSNAVADLFVSANAILAGRPPELRHPDASGIYGLDLQDHRVRQVVQSAGRHVDALDVKDGRIVAALLSRDDRSEIAVWDSVGSRWSTVVALGDLRATRVLWADANGDVLFVTRRGFHMAQPGRSGFTTILKSPNSGIIGFLPAKPQP